MKLIDQSIPAIEAQKIYTILEAERIRHEIACFGSEGLCPHCIHKNVCLSSTTTYRICASRINCDGYNRSVSAMGASITKMKYSFEYDDNRDWW